MERPGCPRGAALVTGGSRGIGRAIALRLARDGFAIAVNYRAAVDLAGGVVREITAGGGKAIALQCDMADPSEAASLMGRALDALGAISVVVCNAGITRDRLLIQMSEEDWLAAWCTDLAGPRALCRAAVEAMSPRGEGTIVTVGSVVGTTGNPGQANYAAAKAALHSLSRQLAVETASAGITVNCVLPGYIPTDAVAHLSDSQRDFWLDRVPLGRAGAVEDIAAAVSFLAGPEARYITGQCLAIDGGYQAAQGRGFAS